MTDPSTAEEMREAAAREAETCDYPRAAPTDDEAACYDAMAERIAAAIRALPIAPAPDREVLVEVAAQALWERAAAEAERDRLRAALESIADAPNHSRSDWYEMVEWTCSTARAALQEDAG